MSGATMRGQSRLDWSSASTTDHLKLGCMQRIADATEAMAKNHVLMQRDLDYYKGAYQRNRAEITRLEKQRSSLRGVITRMKRKATGAQL